jgi:hypothetical protein
MARIIITVQEKGGGGKTTTTLHLAHHLKQLGHDFVLADLDYEPRLLSRYSPACGLISPDVEALKAGQSNAAELVDLALKGRNILIDCGANTYPFWDALFGTVRPNLLDTLKGLGMKMTLVVPVGDDAYSQDYFLRYDSLFPGATKILATIGEGIRSLPGFPAYPDELSITLPRMPVVVMRAVNRFAKPADELCELSQEDRGFPCGLARNAAKAFATEFNRILPHLKP